MIAVGAPRFNVTSYSAVGTYFRYSYFNSHWNQTSGSGNTMTYDNEGRRVAISPERMATVAKRRPTGLFGYAPGAITVLGLNSGVISNAIAPYSSCGDSSTEYGSALSVSHSYVAAGDWSAQCIFVQGTGGRASWTLNAATLNAIGGTWSGKGLGRSVSVSEDWLVFGVPYGTNAANGCDLNGSGCVIAVPRSGDSWDFSNRQVLDGSALSLWGWDLKISQDGSTIVVGSPGSGAEQSDACVYGLVSGTWTLVQCLYTNADPEIDASASFACGVANTTDFASRCWIAISEDGSRIVVGAPTDESSTDASGGSVLLFTKSGATYFPASKYQEPVSGRTLGLSFGTSVAVTNTFVAASRVLPLSTSGTESAVYVWGVPVAAAPQEYSLTSSGESGATLNGSISLGSTPSVSWAATPDFSYVYPYVPCPVLSQSSIVNWSVTAGEPGDCIYSFAAFNSVGFGSGSLALTFTTPRPRNTLSPAVSGLQRSGADVTSSPGSWTYMSGGTYSYSWYRCTTSVIALDTPDGSCSPIGGQSGSSYTLTDLDVGKYIVAMVSATNATGSNVRLSASTGAIAALETQTPAPSEPAPSSQPPASQAPLDQQPVINAPEAPSSPVSGVPTNSVAPALSGSAKVGKLISASPGSWAGSPTLSLQWYRCRSAVKPGSTIPSKAKCAAIARASSATYKIVKADKGKYLTTLAKASNAAGSTTMVSASTSKVK